MKKANSPLRNPPTNTKPDGLISLLRPYFWLIFGLLAFTILSNGLNLFIPKLVSRGIDSYTAGTLDTNLLIFEFVGVSLLIFLFSTLQNIIQIYTSEQVAKDLRMRIIEKISLEDFDFVEHLTPSKLLTNITSDVDSVKTFVSQAIASILSSVFLIIGASTLLILINWKLGLSVLMIVPIIGVLFALVLGKVRKLFKAAQETIDWLNRIINESILGAALVRLLNSETFEYQKFLIANEKAKSIGLHILSLFATLMPIIMLSSNAAVLIILVLGGHYVIAGTMSLGDFVAFNSYMVILIFPIIIIGFMSGVIAQATTSYGRIREVLDGPLRVKTGTLRAHLTGNIEVRNLSLVLAGKEVIKDISFDIKPGSRTAILGPTAAGKTELLYLLSGLIKPTSGTILFDGITIETYDTDSLHKDIGLVFQDSVLFNLSIRENIAFSTTVTDEALKQAIDTAELRDFVDTLPEGLDTVVSERGTSLSGGQKQRIMLARALALNPKILFLDDFTARLDVFTEKKILENVQSAYPQLTLISVTQKIEAIKDYEQIILLMEGELLAEGTHEALMKHSPEYIQIFTSQISTHDYEL